MGKFDAFFQDRGRSKPMGEGRVPKLPEGRHVLALMEYTPTPHKETNGFAYDGVFLVLETNGEGLKAGDVRSEAWFPDQPGDKWGNGARRADDFIEKMGMSAGYQVTDRRIHIPQIGGMMADGELRGVKIVLDKSKAVDRKTGALKVSKQGNQIFNCKWTPVTQTAEEVGAIREFLNANHPIEEGAPAPAAPPLQALQAPVAAAPAAIAAPAVATPAQLPFTPQVAQPAAPPANAPPANALQGFLASLNKPKA